MKKLASVNVVNKGRKYAPTSTVVITPADGLGTATVTVELSPHGQVLAATVTETDAEFTDAPLLEVDGPPGSGCVLEAVMEE